jgi:predicted enzyme related to lactoylglutathione lyase
VVEPDKYLVNPATIAGFRVSIIVFCKQESALKKCQLKIFHMLGKEKLKGFVPTTKPKEAKEFYQNTLGLKFLWEDKYALEFDANGTLLRVAIVPHLTPHPFTMLGWNVGDINSIIKQLNKKKITCERYDFLDQDELGIWTSPNGSKVAWFKDPDGNILSLTEM